MGQFALFLVSAFIIVALLLDIKESRGISQAIWIPFLWFAVSISKPITYWIYPQIALEWTPAYDFIEGNPVERSFLIILMSLGFIILYRRRRRFHFRLTENKYLMMFFCYALISVSWSDYQGPSFKRWIRAVGDIIIVLTILTEENSQGAFECILRRCAIILIPLSVYYIKYVRWIAIRYDRFGLPEALGVTRNKNQLGILCAFLGIFLIWRLISHRPKLDAIDVFLSSIAVYLLFLSNSATSIVVFLAGIILIFTQSFFITDKKKLLKLIAICLIFFLFLQALFVGVIGESITSIFFSATGRDSSFTGRIPLWQSLINIGIKRPIFGSGYGAFWLSDQARGLWSTFIWRPIAGHNGYLDVFMDLGLVGLLLLILLLSQTFKRILSSYEMKNEFHGLQFVLLIMCLMHNMTESSMARGTVFIWLLLLWLSIKVENAAPSIEG